MRAANGEGITNGEAVMSKFPDVVVVKSEPKYPELQNRLKARGFHYPNTMKLKADGKTIGYIDLEWWNAQYNKEEIKEEENE